jgi:hypothetical protein
MDVTVTTGRVVAAVAGLAVLIVLLLLAWIGGELHHRNCLAEADLRYPALVGEAGDAALAAKRADAVSGCSRWP